MKIVSFGADQAVRITSYESSGAASVHLADGQGEAHVYAIHFAPGGQIGPHPTGFAQLFLIVTGNGWVSGADGVQVTLAAGQGAYFACGEVHAKGSETGMTAIMVQVERIDLAEQG